MIRGLMKVAKKKSVAKSELTARDLYAGAIRKEYQNKKNHCLMGLPGDTSVQIGLKCPFVLEYLFNCGCLPLGVLMEVNGAQESCKTMFMYEMGRIFCDYGGWLDMHLTEQKWSPSLAHSIIGWDRTEGLVGPWKAKSMDEMQGNWLKSINDITEMTDKGIDGEPATGRIFPVLFGVDSLMGANMESKTEKIEKKGFADRSFADEARSLTDYLKVVAAKLSGMPYLGLLIRHRKESPGETPYAPVQVSKPGGKHVGYQVSYELILRPVGKQTTEISTGKGEGLDIYHRYIKIQNGKNSAGTNKLHATVRVSWKHVMLGGEVRQITKWHWEEALTQLLIGWQTDMLQRTGVTAGRIGKLDEYLHIRKVKGPKFWSKTLGMEESDAVSAAKLGRLIEGNEEVLQALRQAFGIQESYCWEPPMEYSKAMKEYTKLATEKAAKIKQESDISSHLKQLYEDFE